MQAAHWTLSLAVCGLEGTMVGRVCFRRSSDTISLSIVAINPPNVVERHFTNLQPLVARGNARYARPRNAAAAAAVAAAELPYLHL